MEERPPIPKLEDLREQQRAKREKNTVRRAARRKGESGDGEGGEGDPTLKERHTRVIGGPEVVGGEERVVLENEMGN